jgi:hypothetical protein
MHLLQLAPEILDQIIDWSMPQGFESLVLTCKTLYNSAGARVNLHNNLKRRWQYTIHSSPCGFDHLRLLHDIAKEPLAARYIVNLDLDSEEGFGLLTREEDEDLDFRTDEAKMKRTKEFLMQSPYFARAGVDTEEWWEEILEEIKKSENTDNEDTRDESIFAIISLLLFCPNVEKLRFARSWHNGMPPDGDEEKEKELRIPLLNAIVHGARGPDFEGMTLKKLRVLWPFMPAGYDMKAGFGEIEWFALMPEIEEIFGISLLSNGDKWSGIDFSWQPSLEYTSNVRRLELAFCCMDAEGISRVLERMPRLEVLRYAHEGKWHGCGHVWSAAEFVKAIEKLCGETLVDLAVTCQRSTVIENGVSSFNGFKKLQLLEIDQQIFMGPPVKSGQVRGLEGFTPEYAKPWEENELPCLATMLPQSLRFLHINIAYPDDDDVSKPEAAALNALMKRYGDTAFQHLPGLETTVRQYRAETARMLAIREGCQFENWLDEYMGAQMLMPLWMREFAEHAGPVEFC